MAPHLAYMPLTPAFASGSAIAAASTTPIWIANLADAKIEKIPRENSNDFNPDVGRQTSLFPLRSQRPHHPVLLRPATKKVAQAVHNDGLDIKSARAGPGAIVYEQFGSHAPVRFEIRAERRRSRYQISRRHSHVRPTFEKVAGDDSVTPGFRPPARAPCSKRAARS